jgi:glucose/mannose-6-phosphate isomerase
MADMKTLINDFAQHIDEGVEISKSMKYKQPDQEIRNVVICGMGGSGIGGKLVSLWIQGDIKVPVTLVQEYELPHFVDAHTLIIASSYSGNTEETLIALKAGHAKGAYITGICSGGELHSFCLSNGFDVVVVPGGFPPRAAMAYSIVQLLNIFIQYGMIPAARMDELIASARLIEDNKTAIMQRGEELASFLYGKVGVFYATPEYEGVVIRARQQFNENSKFLCWQHIIPEMNHNELVGWGGGDDRFAVVFFNSEEISPRNRMRYDISKEIISGKTKHVTELHAIGKSQIERSIYLIHIVDWASYYLCELNKADIMDIKVIDYLKGSLAKFN